MIARLLAVWRGRDDIVAGRARYPGWLLPHLLAAAREPEEPPRTAAAARAHDDVSPPTVLLPALRDAGPGAGAAVDVREIADRQPTAAPSTSDRPQVAMGEHEGATEEFATVLAGIVRDLADDPSGLDPEMRDWDRLLATVGDGFDALLAEFERAGSIAQAEFTRGRVAAERKADRIAPGWREPVCGRPRCPLGAHTFDEVRELAGVIVLPAEPVDWATGEWPVLEVAG